MVANGVNSQCARAKHSGKRAKPQRPHQMTFSAMERMS